MRCYCYFLHFPRHTHKPLKTAYLEKASAAKGGVTASFLNYSPHFGHEHDGERCLSDALTQDWIERAGIEEEYRAQEEYQQNMVRLSEGGDRTIYTIPVIFHVVWNTAAENVSEIGYQ